MRGLLAAALMVAVGCTTQAPAPDAPRAPAAPIAPGDLGAFFDCLREAGATLVSAHRGGPGPGAAENSLEAFAHTLARGPALLETDVSMSADGALVLMHDETVVRTTTGEGRVRDLTLDEIRALRLQDETGRALDAHPPTLAEALAWAEGKSVLELDVKRGVPFERVVAAVRAAGAENRVVIIVYNEADAIIVHRLDPRLMIYVTIASERDLQELIDAGVDLSRIVAWTGNREPNAALNVMLRQRGIEARFGTLGDARSWDARFARGEGGGYGAFAETGLQLIATDRPAEAHAALDAADGEGWAAAACLADSAQ